MTGQPITLQTALIYLMIVVAGADQELQQTEMTRIGQIVRRYPVFEEFNVETMIPAMRDCADILSRDDGLATVFGLIRSAIDADWADTAYCVACDVAAADGSLRTLERRILDTVRSTLGVERLAAAAIERATAARWRRPTADSR